MSENSLTILIGTGAPGRIGHVAVAVKTPTEITWSGYGPASGGGDLSDILNSRLNAYTVAQVDTQTGGKDLIPAGWAGVFEHENVSSYTIDISSKQVGDISSALQSFASQHPMYNIFNSSVCSTYAMSALNAIGVNTSPLSVFPSQLDAQLNLLTTQGALTGGENAITAKKYGLSGLVKDYTGVGTGADSPLGHCFARGTLVHISDSKVVPIEFLNKYDYVCSFNNLNSKLERGRISRLLTDLTQEWLVIEFVGQPLQLSVTPGHRFLSADGTFRRIDDIMASDCRVVLADGSVVEVTAERVVYSEATAHLYEKAERVVYPVEGGLALAPRIERGWKTYNFEVEEYHTYIAGGVRVHNDSQPTLLAAEGEYQKVFGSAFDASDPASVDKLTGAIIDGRINSYGDYIGVLRSTSDISGNYQAAFYDQVRGKILGDAGALAGSGWNGPAGQTVTDASGNRFTYDAAGRLSSFGAASGDGSSVRTEFGYSSDGNPYQSSSVVTNGQGQIVSRMQNVVDAASGRVLSSTSFNPDGTSSQTTFALDGSGNVQTIIDRDASGLITTKTDLLSNGSYAQSEFDGSGRLTSTQVTNADGDLTSSIDYFGDGSRTVSDYGGSGFAIDAKTFDASGNLIEREVDTYDGASLDQTMSNGQVTGSRYSSGRNDEPDIAGNLGATFGSALGGILGGNSLEGRIALSTVGGLLGKAVANSFSMSGGYPVRLPLN